MKVLCAYFNITLKRDSSLIFNTELNYFSITVLLFYIKDISTYSSILEELKKVILDKFKFGKTYGWKDNTELVLLLLDSISCPFLNDEVRDHFKNKVKDARTRNSKNLKSYIKEFKDEKYRCV